MRPTTQVSGGQRLAQRLGSIKRELQRNSKVLVGVPKDAGSYEDGPSLAVVAAVQEFGSADGRIPERSFLRVPLRASQEELSKVVSNQARLVFRGELSAAQLMGQLGARAASVSQTAIDEGIGPPNAPSTVERKGSDTPLIDSGALRQAITYVIEDDE